MVRGLQERLGSRVPLLNVTDVGNPQFVQAETTNAAGIDGEYAMEIDATAAIEASDPNNPSAA